MSHMAKIEAEVTDLEVAAAAAKRLGGELVKGQTTYKWFGRWVGDSKMPEGLTVDDLGKCQHAIRFPNCEYEVGLVPAKGAGNKWNVVWDYWRSGGLNAVIGKEGGLFRQAYAIEAAKKAARIKGFTCTEKSAANGKIRLEVLA